MDFVAPALVGLGFFFIYEAWQSHKTGQTPAPIAHILEALGQAGAASPSSSAPAANSVAGAAPESPANAAAPSSGGSAFGGGAIHP